MNQEFTKRTFTIGGDPEFVLKDVIRKCIVRAKDYQFFNKVGEKYKIGRDGAAYPVEIRPSPAYINKLPIMIADIYNIIKKISVFCFDKNLVIESGAMCLDVSIGGHIHFGGRDILSTMSVGWQKNIGKKVHENIEKFIKRLDFFLTPIMNFFLSRREIGKRAKRGYGRMNSYRTQNWGIEYRTPYCFLASPLMVKGLYGLACLIAHHYRQLKMNVYEHSLLYNYAYQLRDNISSLKITEKNIYNIIKPKILKMMSQYSPNPQYNPYILSLFSLIEQKKTIISKDVIANYGLKKQQAQPIIVLKTFSLTLDKLQKIIHNAFKGTKATILLQQFNGYVLKLNRIYLSSNHTMPKKLSGMDIKTLTHEDKTFDIHIGIDSPLVMNFVNNIKWQEWLFKYIKNIIGEGNV